MSKTVQLNPVAAAVAVVVAPALTPNQAKAVLAQAVALSNADKTFANAVVAISTEVARILGDKPSYDHWTLVQTAFITDYAKAREVKEDSARQRWVKVAETMKAEFALEKPAKPTQAAEVKAKQRTDAAGEAAKLIAAAGATTPEAILKLSANKDAPVAAGVVSALASAAGKAAAEASQAARDAAREEAKALRESIRKELQNLTLVQLRRVAASIEKMKEPAPTTQVVISGAAADVGQGAVDAPAASAKPVLALVD